MSIARVTVDLSSRKDHSYTIHLGQDASLSLEQVLSERSNAHQVALIADKKAYALHGRDVEAMTRKLFPNALLLLVPSGERSKSRRRKASLEDAMIEAGLGRDSLVIAFGGGVVGDLAGYVAATYLRGIPFIQIPTTLLAQVDSSIGGKVAINTKAGKNLLGAFHQPVCVLADIQFLSTLPPRQFRSGLAELIKHAIIADAELFEQLDQQLDSVLQMDPWIFTEALRRSMLVKARVVQQDEKEGGLRKILNWGHTLGHAVESLSGYKLLHGECVALGMCMEARLCHLLGWLSKEDEEREIGILKRAGLPVKLPDWIDPRKVLDATQVDKKVRGGRVQYLVHDKIGSMSDADGMYTVGVPEKEILSCIA